MSAPIRALVAEDEAPQREALIDALGHAWPELAVDAVQDGLAALESLRRSSPAVAFLDVRMPGVSGLDVARTAAGQGVLVVFTTAYDEYAIRAFETGAIDYLMKPVARARLDQTVARLKQRLVQPEQDLAARIAALERQLAPTREQRIRWIGANVGDTVRMLAIEDVLYFQARDKYVSVVTEDGEAIIRTPLKELLAGLDPERFWQVHRGVIVCVAAIASIEKNELGRHGIRLRGRDVWLPVSEAFLHRFRAM